MATREAIQRWQSVLNDVLLYGTIPSGQRARRELGSPQARANVLIVNSTPIYGMVKGVLTTPVMDLWSIDPPKDPKLVSVLDPVRTAALAITPYKELLTQWNEFERTVQSACTSLKADLWDAPTVDEIIAEMLLSLKTTLLLAGTGLQGSMRIIAEELIKRQVSFALPITLPLRHFDLATNSMVDRPSKFTLSLAGLKPIVEGDSIGATTTPDSPSPAIMKQFAAQSIVDFYTDWEEYYRAELARVHNCNKQDFRIEYFGDLSKIRQDYVHNRGICRNSARCKILKWFTKGDLMVPTPANYLQLITEFPESELRVTPQQVLKTRGPVTGQIDLTLVREFERVANEVRGNASDALEEAISQWVSANRGKP